MHPPTRSMRALVATATLALAATAAPAVAGDRSSGRHPGPDQPAPQLQTVVPLTGARGVDALGRGRTLVTEADGSVSLVVERRRTGPVTIPLGSVPAGGVAPAVAAGPRGSVYVLTGGGEPGAELPAGAATLYRWRPGDVTPRAVADIAAYQRTDPDPADLESLPEDSNPFGLAVLPGGDALVADAAGNDLLRVAPDGAITTVARLLPRSVAAPAGLPPGSPPAGTVLPSEAVPTSVAVGRDGAYYVGELRGFPATPGTSQIWRVDPRAVGAGGATCDPEAPAAGACTRVADGLTSIVDLAAAERSRGHHGDSRGDSRGDHGRRDGQELYAVSLSLQSWLAVESGGPGSEVGGLFRVVTGGGPGDQSTTAQVTELLAGQLTLPGGVDVADDRAYLTWPVFGPGSLSAVDLR